MKRLHLLLVYAIPTFCILGCDDDKSAVVAPVPESEQMDIVVVSVPESVQMDEVVDSISWVGTDFIYSDTTPRKPLTAVYIYTDWCGWCRKMKTEVFTDSAVINTLHNNFNSVRVNPEVDSSVVYQDTSVSCYHYARVIYDIRGVPTTVILDSSNQVIGKIIGYQPADQFLAYLETVIAM